MLFNSLTNCKRISELTLKASSNLHEMSNSYASTHPLSPWDWAGVGAGGWGRRFISFTFPPRVCLSPGTLAHSQLLVFLSNFSASAPSGGSHFFPSPLPVPHHSLLYQFTVAAGTQQSGQGSKSNIPA